MFKWLSYKEILRITRQTNLSKKLPYVLSLMALLCGIATYWALTRNVNVGEKSKLIITFLYVDVAVLLLLLGVIVKRIVELWMQRRARLKGSKLHVHIVALFTFVTITPSILVVIFSSLFFNIGVDAWFGKPVRDALQQAQEVAESYLKDHKKVIEVDALSIVNRFRPWMPYFLSHSEELSQHLNQEAEARGLEELLVFNSQKNIIGKSYLTFALQLTKILKADFEKAKKDEIVIMESEERVRALIKIDPATETYLLIGKKIDPVVLNHVDQTYSAIKNYTYLSTHHSDLHVTFVVFFLIISLLLLMAAIWVGLSVADLLVRPITQLIAAAEAVSQGDLKTKLEVNVLNNEIDDLCRSFNRMTTQLFEQQQNLIISQKKSAWADVARKIAHEIKNPLTPIQLSAERLKRKYLSEISVDPQTFQNCVDTIIRQVGQIGNLVNEFSSFARMPEPKLEKGNWIELCKQAMFLQSQAYPQIDFHFNSNVIACWGEFDPNQINQVLTNILQNAINALNELQPALKKSIIHLQVNEEEDKIIITIEDNGPGFPKEGREKLLEPYYTTREKGTGLGLAIVSKIVSDHNGRLDLQDSLLGGAKVTLEFFKNAHKEKVSHNVI